MDSVEAVSARDKHKSFFLPAKSVVLVDEDEEDEDDEVSNTVYSLQNNDDGIKNSSQVSSILEEEAHKEVEEGLLDVLDRCCAMLLDGEMPAQYPDLRVATFMRDGLQLTVDLMALNKGWRSKIPLIPLAPVPVMLLNCLTASTSQKGDNKNLLADSDRIRNWD
ncbi:hypothetical protein BC939DRAFT_499832 [Gamsiella multidivaricata]|uniref:uncharacterized protein n=1 Tax=Gamsiella multidivaricata TaxID=101098 RepID=UPI002220E339|nr:uncharacterized protein BC939DRAFT_499832 [Gamsiella multidivaricata]KAI7829705.1 hypothetical protein BC939DRAFT_499832 [Gamsiella multidivaricata]